MSRPAMNDGDLGLIMVAICLVLLVNSFWHMSLDTKLDAICAATPTCEVVE